ncbi:MAG: glutamate racemase [Bacillota bacterium]
MDKFAPIGVFDSGVGGLTVVRELLKHLPAENVIYYGDTAHVPYGSKTREQLLAYGRSIMEYLTAAGVKLVLVACNTSSSLTLEALAAEFPVPMIGMIKPGAKAAAAASKNGKIGVIATEATTRSQAYPAAIKALRPEAEVLGQACPKFVPLVESGRFDTEETVEAVREYVLPLLAEGIDTLVYGCTHYPFLEPVIRRLADSDLTLVDPAQAVVREAEQLLASRGLAAEGGQGQYRFVVSGDPLQFQRVGKILLGDIIKQVEKADR